MLSANLYLIYVLCIFLDAKRVAPISACVFLQLSLIQPVLIKTETSDNNYHI